MLKMSCVPSKMSLVSKFPSRASFHPCNHFTVCWLHVLSPSLSIIRFSTIELSHGRRLSSSFSIFCRLKALVESHHVDSFLAAAFLVVWLASTIYTRAFVFHERGCFIALLGSLLVVMKLTSCAITNRGFSFFLFLLGRYPCGCRGWHRSFLLTQASLVSLFFYCAPDHFVARDYNTMLQYYLG
jgi:hypothetical protein